MKKNRNVPTASAMCPFHLYAFSTFASSLYARTARSPVARIVPAPWHDANVRDAAPR